LDLTAVSTQGQKGAKKLADAFNNRFGLNITLNADTSGRESRTFGKAIVETKTGIAPTFDLMQGGSENVLRLKEAGGAEPIENWNVLLAEIAPQAYKVKDQVSPPAIAGYGFLLVTRIYGLVYNPKLISEREIPKTRKRWGTRSTRGLSLCPLLPQQPSLAF